MSESENQPAQRAVVDRIVEGVAVLLVGDEEVERHLDAADLPDGAGEGSVLTVRGDSLSCALVEEESDSRADLRARMGRLLDRRPSGRFGEPGPPQSD